MRKQGKIQNTLRLSNSKINKMKLIKIYNFLNNLPTRE